jgi:RecJ-like exonuclease
MCGTALRSGLCGACRGKGKSGLFNRDCKHCGGTGKAIGCQYSFSHPGLGPQQAWPVEL